MNSTTRWLASNATTTASGLEPSFKAGVLDVPESTGPGEDSSDDNALLIALPFILVVAGALVAGTVIGGMELRKKRTGRKAPGGIEEPRKVPAPDPLFDRTQDSASLASWEATQESEAIGTSRKTTTKTGTTSTWTSTDCLSSSSSINTSTSLKPRLNKDDEVVEEEEMMEEEVVEEEWWWRRRRLPREEEMMRILKPRFTGWKEEEGDKTDTGTSLSSLMDNSLTLEPTETFTSLVDLMDPSLGKGDCSSGSDGNIAPARKSSESGISRALIPPLIKE